MNSTTKSSKSVDYSPVEIVRRLDDQEVRLEGQDRRLTLAEGRLDKHDVEIRDQRILSESHHTEQMELLRFIQQGLNERIKEALNTTPAKVRLMLEIVAGAVVIATELFHGGIFEFLKHLF